MKKKNNKGFTLVELLVVIAIIGILAVVAVPSLVKNINKANASDVTSYISAVKTQAMAMYADGSYDDTGTYKGTYDKSGLVDATIDTVEEAILDNISDRPDVDDAKITNIDIAATGVITIEIDVKNDDIQTYVKTQLGITDLDAGTTGDKSTIIKVTSLETP